MSLFENIRLAWEGVKSNKMRSTLTMLGIIIGIAAVITIMTISGGVSGSITDSMGALGASNIMVSIQQKGSEDDGRVASSSMSESDLITDAMIEEFKQKYSDSLAGISLSQSAGSAQAKDGKLYANLSMTGVNTEYVSANNVTMLKGRAVSQRDIDSSRNVAVVSDRLCNNLFGGDYDAALGKELLIYRGSDVYSYLIVGVYEYEQSMLNFQMASEKDMSTPVYIPISTAKRLVGAREGYSSITVVTKTGVDSIAFADTTAEFFAQYYVKNDNFTIGAMSMESIVSQFNSIMTTVSAALGVIAGISLVVGGIGVMNIMLVSVTERTREIGTRKAIGARNSSIRAQFVVESAIICLIGGLIGVVLGGALGYVGSLLLGFPSWPSVSSIALAVGFSMAIGIFFGSYPASKAAKLDPVEALRYE